MEQLPGPLYRTWDEAMNDPDLDLTRPWFVADPDAPGAAVSDGQWPEGWVDIGYTEESAE